MLKHKDDEGNTLTAMKRVLFENYFQIIEQKEQKLTAACKLCETVVKDGRLYRDNLRNHLKVSVFKRIPIKGFS